VFGQALRDIMLMPDRQRMVGTAERQHDARECKCGRQRELEPARQRPLQRKLQHAHDDEQLSRNPRAQIETTATTAVVPSEHGGGQQQRRHHQENQQQGIFDPPARDNAGMAVHTASTASGQPSATSSRSMRGAQCLRSRKGRENWYSRIAATAPVSHVGRACNGMSRLKGANS
jgi:hypothetical protein